MKITITIWAEVDGREPSKEEVVERVYEDLLKPHLLVSESIGNEDEFALLLKGKFVEVEN